MVVEITTDSLALEDRIAMWAHRRSGYSIDDARGAGMAGLVEASRKWRPDHGTEFATFAGNHIRWAIQDEMRRMSPGTRKQQVEGNRPVVVSIDSDEFYKQLPTTDDVEAEVLDGFLSQQVVDMVFLLPWRYARAVFETVVCGRTLADVGRQFGVTDAAICRNRKQGLQMLREQLADWDEVA